MNAVDHNNVVIFDDEPYRIQGGYYLVRRRKGKQSIIYIGCLPIRTNWKNRKRNVRFNKSMYAIL